MLVLEPYISQLSRWPQQGKHVLAQFDDSSVVVYQAYRPSIGQFAAEHGWFGGEFSLGRMSWIKPNFLWMMYRSGWGTKEGQEVVLAIWLRRSAFDEILTQAVASSFSGTSPADRKAWQAAVASSHVRLQWDPDHDPTGRAVERRAIQLGLRGIALAQYAQAWILRIEDVSEHVAEQRDVLRRGGLDDLVTPREEVYPIPTAALDSLGLARDS
jgi:hypothetical protein